MLDAAASPLSGKGAPARAATSMWDLVNENSELEEEALEPAPELVPFPSPAPAAQAPARSAPDTKGATALILPVQPAGRGAEMGDGANSRRIGRAKTRLLGFDHSNGTHTDIFQRAKAAPRAGGESLPVGWLVVIRGPGRGASIPLAAGVSQVGRDEDQAVQIDFGDTSISRTNHAAIAFDPETRSFFVGHGGKSNLVRLNDKPLLSTETLNNGDEIRIGETTLRLVALCGEAFTWSEQVDEPSAVNG